MTQPPRALHSHPTSGHASVHASDGGQPGATGGACALSAVSAPGFSATELQHYQRQLLLQEVGIEGQRALKAGRVLVIGAGGLGSPVLLYLAAAGVGTLGIVEHDTVDRSNLHRQVLFGVDAIGQSKAEVGRERLLQLNPHVCVDVHRLRLDADNAAALVAGYDLVVDATDNFTARYLINEVCMRAGKPNISASILRFEGQLSVFMPGGGPCYRCLYPEAPPAHLAPSCAEAGVLGSLPGAIGALQATEALKLLLGLPPALAGRLLTFDALDMQFRTLEVARDPHCPVCRGLHARPTPRPAALPAEAAVRDISVTALRKRLQGKAAPFLLDVRREGEFLASHIDGATLLPLDRLAACAAALPAGVPIVCICQKGMRSRTAAQLLTELGFADVRSLAGGMDAWDSARAEREGGDVAAAFSPEGIAAAHPA